MSIICWYVRGPSGQRISLRWVYVVAPLALLFLAANVWPAVWPVLSVAIDAGHGGNDPGAVGPRGLKEKVVTLDVARSVTGMLRDAGVYAHLIRSTDARLASSQRSDLRARVRTAHETEVDILVSIHVNSHTLRYVRGPRTYYQPGSVQGRKLAACIQGQLREAVGYGNLEPVPEDHLITRESKMPAVIVELGYISNPEEEKMLRSLAFRKKLAQAVCEGILRCYDNG